MAWFNGDFLYTHNALINMVIGPRGHGKTYWAKCRAIRNFIKKGEEFIYLRRRVTEIDKVKSQLFDDVIRNEEFPDVEISYSRNGTYLIDGEVAGYPLCLGNQNYLKSVSFANVTMIIYDEFIVDESNQERYLKNEVNRMLNLYDTVDRYEGRVKCFLLANSLSFVNPHTAFWKLRKPEPGGISKNENKNVLIYLDYDYEFFEKQKSTKFGSLIDGTKYGDYSLYNEFVNDSFEFIEKKSGNCSYCFGMKYLDNIYGVWANYTSGLLYVSTDIEPTSNLIYSITMDDHTPNTLLINRHKTVGFFKVFIDIYFKGNMRFESMEVKNVCYEIISILKGY